MQTQKRSQILRGVQIIGTTLVLGIKTFLLLEMFANSPANQSRVSALDKLGSVRLGSHQM